MAIYSFLGWLFYLLSRAMKLNDGIIKTLENVLMDAFGISDSRKCSHSLLHAASRTSTTVEHCATELLASGVLHVAIGPREI
jgi:hypothetical protein